MSKKGDLGGFVESERNLSQLGNCWIYDNAKCMDNAKIYMNAKMYDNTEMCDSSHMYNDAALYHSAKMFDNAVMWGNARILDNSSMYDNSTMLDSSVMYGNGLLEGNQELHSFSNGDHTCNFYKTKEGNIYLRAGCLKDIRSWSELKKALKEEYGKVSELDLQLAKAHLRIFKRMLKKV